MQESTSLLSIVDSTLAGNTASDGGGLYSGMHSATSLVGTAVVSNFALGAGGGLACIGCSMLRVLAYIERNHALEVRVPSPLATAQRMCMINLTLDAIPCMAIAPLKDEPADYLNA
jgi:hypothetical protein